MAEVILVVLQRAETAGGLLQAAERLSELANGAHIYVVAASTPADSDLMRLFNEWAAVDRPAPLQAQWHAVVGDPVATIIERGSRADLIVIARPIESDDHAVRQGFRAALLRTGRPILVVPPGHLAIPDFGRHVAIAWREDEHTPKAVLPALRYVTAAERIFILAGTRPGRTPPAIPEVLDERGVASELYLMPIGPTGFGEPLLAKVHELGADLLVMGAYAHNPLHDLVYGGVTRFMLGHADVPVLLRY